MTPGPLPPHERAWRHPSEIGAPAHEPTSRIGHFLIGSIAAVSLMLIAWLAISMTPKRYGDADEVLIVSSDDGAGTSFGLSAGAPGDGLTPAEHVLRVMSTIIAEQSRQNASQIEGTSTVAATFVGGADRPAATGGATSAEPTVPSTTVESTVLDPADTTADTTTGAATEVIATPVTDGAESSTPGVLLLADPSDLSDLSESESSADPAAAADSTAEPTSTTSTSTTSTTTSTSTTSTTTTSTTSTSTVPTSMPAKQFS